MNILKERNYIMKLINEDEIPPKIENIFIMGEFKQSKKNI